MSEAHPQRIPWRFVSATLIAAAAVGAIVRAADASIVGRMGGVFAALLMFIVAAATWRRQRWAFGAAFLIAVCWFWAAISLRIQSVISGPEAMIWLSWSVVVIVASVLGREPEPTPRFPPMAPPVGEDEGHDG